MGVLGDLGEEDEGHKVFKDGVNFRVEGGLGLGKGGLCLGEVGVALGKAGDRLLEAVSGGSTRVMLRHDRQQVEPVVTAIN